jgi:hypothetical protein
MMGQAKRRKQANIYPVISNPADVIVPEGKIAITLDIESQIPMTFVFNADYVIKHEAAFGPDMASKLYRDVVGSIHKLYETARAARNRIDLEVCGLMAIWSTFNHPQSGQEMRRTVSSCLRQQGKAHITWRLRSSGLKIVATGEYVDPDQIEPGFYLTDETSH